MSDKTMESLRQAFMKDKENIVDECPMGDQIAAYAFGELGPEESGKVNDHLKTCRYCLDLSMDIRMAEEDAKNEKVEVLPGLQSAINSGKKQAASPLQKIGAAISDFFGEGFSLKPVAAFATVILLILGGIYVLWDKPTPDTPYAIKIMLHGRTQIGFRDGQPEHNEFNDFLVEPGGQMKSGDYFRFQTKIDKDAYVYVVLQDSSGNIEALEKGLIAGNKDFFLPDGNKWYYLDKNTGTEKLYLLTSKNKIKDQGFEPPQHCCIPKSLSLNLG